MNNEADVVIGSRMMTAKTALQGGMPKYKYYGNIILTKMQIAYGIETFRIPFRLPGIQCQISKKYSFLGKFK
jgi:hypothetical protein